VIFFQAVSYKLQAASFGLQVVRLEMQGNLEGHTSLCRIFGYGRENSEFSGEI
jgi:hypothetical protein